MSVFDGSVLRVTAYVKRVRGGVTYTDTRYAFDETHARNMVRGFKGRRHIVAVEVDELRYVANERADLSFNREDA